MFRGTVRRLEQRAWGLHHAHSPLRHGLKNEKNRRTGLAMSASTIFSMAKGGNIDASLGAYRQHFRRDLEPHRVEEWLEELAAEWPELPLCATSRIQTSAYVPCFTAVGVADVVDLLDFGTLALAELEANLRKVPGAMLADVESIVAAIVGLTERAAELRRRFRAQLPTPLPDFGKKKPFILPDKVESPRTRYDSWILRSLELEVSDTVRVRETAAADKYVAELLPPIVPKKAPPKPEDKAAKKRNAKSRIRHAMFKSNLLNALKSGSTTQAADALKLPRWVEQCGWDFEGDNTKILEDAAFTGKLVVLGMLEGGALKLMPDMVFESSTVTEVGLRHLGMLHRKHPSLTDVHISTGCIEVLEDALEALGVVPTIAALAIENSQCRGNLDALHSLAQETDAKQPMSLALLSLSGCTKISGALSAIGSPQKYSTSPAIGKLFAGLSVLNLSGASNVTGRLDDICPFLTQLDTLVLDHTKVCGSLEALASLKNLTQLSLDRCERITGKLALHHLKGCLRLTHLNLSGTQIEDASLEALSVLANLRELRLRGCVLLEGEIAPLATCAALEVLDLSAHKTMAISGNLDALCVADTGKGLSCLRELNLTNCRLIGGEMSAAIVDFISGIRTAHGSAAARLQGCGRFQLPVDLVSLEEWEAAVCAAAAEQAAALQAPVSQRSELSERKSSRASSRINSRESARGSSRLSKARTATKSRESGSSSRAASAACNSSARSPCEPIVLVNGRADRIDLSEIGSLEGELSAFAKITGMRQLNLAGTKVGGTLSMLSECKLIEALDLSRIQKYMYGASVTTGASTDRIGVAAGTGEITGDLCGLPGRCRHLSSLKLRNCWRLRGDCAKDLKYSLPGPTGEDIGAAWSAGGSLACLDLHGTNFSWPRDAPKGSTGFRTYLKEKDAMLLGCSLRAEPPPPSSDDEEEENGDDDEDENELEKEGGNFAGMPPHYEPMSKPKFVATKIPARMTI